MKKVFALSLIVALLLADPAYAADVDLSSMQLDELYELKTAINLAILSHPDFDSSHSQIIGPGVLLAGVDFPIGRGRLSYNAATSFDELTILIYPDKNIV